MRVLQRAFKKRESARAHLGFAEDDPIRGQDSFAAFNECLNLAVAEKVDFMLQGGDLFHKANPSQATMYKTMKMLEESIFGDGDIDF